MPPRHWTLEEANAALPELRQVVGAMLRARQRILDARPEVWPVLEKSIGNGGSRKAGDLINEFERMKQSTEQVSAMGIHLKDMNTGLVDFLAERDGREIFLCWRFDEPQVQFWHELEAGLAGRQPIVGPPEG